MKKLFALLVLFAVTTWAATGYYQDHVMDKYGNAQYNRIIQLRLASDTTTTSFTDTTDSDGNWSFSTITPGTWIVYVDSVREGEFVFVPDIMDSFTIGDAATDTVRFRAYAKFSNNTNILTGLSDSLSAHDKLYDSLPELKGTITQAQIPAGARVDTARASSISDSAKGGAIRARTAAVADSCKGRSVTATLATTATLADSATGSVRSRSADTSRAAGVSTIADSTKGGSVRSRSADTSRAAGVSTIADSTKGGAVRSRTADTSRAASISDSTKGGAIRAQTAIIADSTKGGSVRARTADTARAASITDSAKGGSIRSQTSLVSDSCKGGAIRSRTSAVADSCKGRSVTATLADSAAGAARLKGQSGAYYVDTLNSQSISGNKTFTAKLYLDTIYADGDADGSGLLFKGTSGSDAGPVIIRGGEIILKGASIGSGAIVCSSASDLGADNILLYSQDNINLRSGKGDRVIIDSAALQADTIIGKTSVGVHIHGNIDTARLALLSDSTAGAIRSRTADTARASSITDSTKGGAIRSRSADTSRAAGVSTISDSTKGGAVRSRSADTSRASGVSTVADSTKGGAVRLAGSAGSAYMKLADNWKATGNDTLTGNLTTAKIISSDTIKAKYFDGDTITNTFSRGLSGWVDSSAHTDSANRADISDSCKGRAVVSTLADSATGAVRSRLADSSAHADSANRADISDSCKGRSVTSTLADSSGGAVRLASYAGSAYPRLAISNTFSPTQFFSDSVVASTVVKGTDIAVNGGVIKSSSDTVLVPSADDARIDGNLTVRESLYVTEGARINTNFTVDDSLNATSMYARRVKADTIRGDSLNYTAAKLQRAKIDTIKLRTVMDTVKITELVYNVPHLYCAFKDSGATCTIGAGTDTMQLTNGGLTIWEANGIETLGVTVAKDTFKIKTDGGAGDYEVRGAISIELDSGDSLTWGIQRYRSGVKAWMPGVLSCEATNNNTTYPLPISAYIEDAAVDDKYIVFIRNKSGADVKLQNGFIEIKLLHR